MAQLLSTEEKDALRADFKKKYPAQQKRAEEESAQQESTDGTAESTEPTKEELYERATSLEIKGRSSMDKDQLKSAIEEAEAND